jgi:hypothetical protein
MTPISRHPAQCRGGTVSRKSDPPACDDERCTIIRRIAGQTLPFVTKLALTWCGAANCEFQEPR